MGQSVVGPGGQRADRQFDTFHEEGQTVTAGEVMAVLRSPSELTAMRFLNPRVYMPGGHERDVDWRSDGTWELS